MATADQIASLRLLIAEPDETTYTDENLDTRIDTSPSLDHVAYAVWTEKAAAYTALVDKSEGGSSRSNGSLQAKALEMVKLFERRINLDEQVSSPTSAGYTVIQRLSRS